MASAQWKLASSPSESGTLDESQVELEEFVSSVSENMKTAASGNSPAEDITLPQEDDDARRRRRLAELLRRRQPTGLFSGSATPSPPKSEQKS